MADKKAGEGAKLEEFKWSAILKIVSKLATPASNTEASKLVAFQRRWRGDIGVGFFVVMVREVIGSWKDWEASEWNDILYSLVLRRYLRT